MSTSSEKKFRMNEGDWICNDPQCGNVNFARRSTCNRCGKAIAGSGSPISEHHVEEKSSSIPQRKKLGHEIGKAAAEKSRGLFSADDWQCGRCGNVNWARRQQCNMCNAPKYGEVEERTGLGGGYNERENIEYIEREESDGEYDDFGRKKKKFRGADGKSDDNYIEPKKSKPEKEPIIRPKLEIETEKKAVVNDEEEDEEDEEDLSKYDFSDWGGDSPKKQTNDKNSHSRSSSSESHSSSSSNSSSSSRSHSQGSHSSTPHSRSATPTPKRHKRTNSRSRSSSYDSRSRHRRRSRSSSHSPHYRSRSRSRDRERSVSKSPKPRKR